MKEGLFALIQTNKGEINIRLEFEKTPGTVGNFAGLATGKIKNDIKPIGEPYYNGLKFHRVINDFMVQTGCPLGTGTGDPGYKFDDEFNIDLRHDRAGILSMANAGPNTGGSQFFLTTVATPWLNGNHAVFGQVSEGMDVVQIIEKCNKLPGDRPAQPQQIIRCSFVE